MKRREFITLLGGSAISFPLVATAQQPERVRRIGILMSLPESDPEAQLRFKVIREELHKHGWIEGSTAQIDVRWYGGELERQHLLAKELIELRPDILIGQSTTAVIAFLKQTQTIPVVFVNITDPVGQGFVSSLAKPGGNITGFSNFELAIGGKWLGLLKDIAPQLARVTLMFNPDTAPYYQLYVHSLENAAPSFSVRVSATPVRNTDAIESVLTAAGSAAGSGLILPPDIFTSNHRSLIYKLTNRYRVPALYSLPYLARDGGLMSYGPDIVSSYRRLTSYVDRILRGEKPGELPVQQPEKFQFVINLKTAKSLGLEFPAKILAIADEVIE